MIIKINIGEKWRNSDGTKITRVQMREALRTLRGARQISIFVDKGTIYSQIYPQREEVLSLMREKDAIYEAMNDKEKYYARTEMKIVVDKKLGASYKGVPNFIGAYPQGFNIMVGELTAGQFGRFVKSTSYPITGDGADLLIKALAGSSQQRSAVFLNLEDGRAYAKWLSGITGRNLRIPYEEEWENATLKIDDSLETNAVARDDLTGNRKEWTESSRGGDFCVFRGFRNCRDDLHMEKQLSRKCTVRLIEDLSAVSGKGKA
ncbi:MAG: SUMF1/EgtB/PvdO family nonheme iron enzyme [Candidatus Saganbacteria bacterium]|nr:SUMF1/EgtB/PvdO family nonheme iron enzyme [Candidatus Saganbacteria bacterium]